MITSVSSRQVRDDEGGARLEIATAHGTLEASHPANAAIVDLDRAVRGPDAMVQYACDLHVLHPPDTAPRNGVLLYEVTNRGRNLLESHLGVAALLAQGHTLAWSGWDADADGLRLEPPPLVAAHVAEITEELVAHTRRGPMPVFPLSFAAVDGAGRLTMRRRRRDVPIELPWRRAGDRAIALVENEVIPGALYDFTYRARDGHVNGVGLAAVRDVVSFLRTRLECRFALGFGISQAGRFLRQFVGLGLNVDESGRRVFDGVLAHSAGIGRVWLNTPFAQPFRTRTAHEDHDAVENDEPFAVVTGADAEPRFMQTNSSTEYWQKGASLLHTDRAGTRDVEPPANARYYLVAGTPHGGRPALPSDRGPCRHPRNPLDPTGVLAGLLEALRAWVVDDAEPPASCVPRIDDGTLVDASQLAFPAIPGVSPPRSANDVARARPLVPQVDPDGNEIAGIQLPELIDPIATYAGWNFYAHPYPDGELADREGACWPFPLTEVDRQRTGDPRCSLAERERGR